jgi:hypothetical protein
MLPAGPGVSHAPRPPQDWIVVPVPPVVSEQAFAQVQAKPDANQQGAARNTRHEYLLRALISCGACRLGCTGRQTTAGYRYYLCRGRTDPLRAAQGQRCTARYIPAGQLDELGWADLCALLTGPAQVTRALARAQGGAWLPQELQARQATTGQALGQLERQQQRLLDACLAEVIALAELDRNRQDLDRRRGTLLAQQRQLDAAARQKLELGAVADGIEAFCQTARAGLATATFEQRRLLADLLIDRVVVTDSQVEIRYVLPTSPDGPHRPFCQLCKDHLDPPPGHGHGDQPGQRERDRAWTPAQVVADGAGVAVPAEQQHAVPVAVSVRGVVGLDRDHRPVVVLGSLGSRAGAHPLPGTRSDQPGGCLRGHPAAGGQPHHVAGAHRHHVTAAAGPDAATQLHAAVHLVAGDEGSADTAAAGAGQQSIGQLRFGGEHDLIGHTGQLAAFFVGGPAGRQVQSPVDQGMPGRGGVGEGDSYLAQRDPADDPAILTGRAHAVGGRLDIGRLIHDQHRITGIVAGTQVPDRPVRCGLEHLLLIAAGARQQMLQPERTLVPDRLGDAPAVVILQLHQQAPNHVAAGEAGLSPGETRRDPRQQVLQQTSMHIVIYPGLSGCCVTVLFHKPA